MEPVKLHPAGVRRLYACCHAALDLPVPVTFSVASLAALLAGHGSGRPVYVVAMRNGPKWASAWVADPEADWIVYRQTAPRAARIWYTVHQASHLLLGHSGAQVSGEMFADLLFSGLNRALGKQVSLTCGLATAEEDREARTLAAEVMRAAAQVRAGAAW